MRAVVGAGAVELPAPEPAASGGVVAAATRASIGCCPFGVVGAAVESAVFAAHGSGAQYAQQVKALRSSRSVPDPKANETLRLPYWDAGEVLACLTNLQDVYNKEGDFELRLEIFGGVGNDALVSWSEWIRASAVLMAADANRPAVTAATLEERRRKEEQKQERAKQRELKLKAAAAEKQRIKQEREEQAPARAARRAQEQAEVEAEAEAHRREGWTKLDVSRDLPAGGACAALTPAIRGQGGGAGGACRELAPLWFRARCAGLGREGRGGP